MSSFLLSALAQAPGRVKGSRQLLCAGLQWLWKSCWFPRENLYSNQIHRCVIDGHVPFLTSILYCPVLWVLCSRYPGSFYWSTKDKDGFWFLPDASKLGERSMEDYFVTKETTVFLSVIFPRGPIFLPNFRVENTLVSKNNNLKCLLSLLSVLTQPLERIIFSLVS